MIKKHERTRRDKEDDRTRHIVELRAQTGVVFLTYHASRDVDRRLATRVTLGAAALRLRGGRRRAPHDLAGGRRRCARARRARSRRSRRSTLPTATIARPAPRARARELNAGATGAGDADTFIAVAFPDNQMQILPYNRTVKDLAGRTPAAVPRRAAQTFTVTDGAGSPRGKGEVSMYLDGRWYTIDLSQATPADDSRASALDVALLQHHVLEPMLAIGDIRTDKRIDFVGGARGTAALEQAVESGKAAVAFSMFPVTIEDLMAISDAGGHHAAEVARGSSPSCATACWMHTIDVDA